jgi:tetratricopeptide (TPR) repeat protein
MLSRINRLIGAILIIAASLYVVILNREVITIRITPSSEITTSGGVIYIALFCLGILATALVATFFGFKAYLRERHLLYKERVREAFYQNMLKARSALAAGELGKAKDLWLQILKREPSNIVARVELSRSLAQAGESVESLKVLDAARAASPENVEVLLRAAEANVELGNKTAAIDNLALAMYHHPSALAATLARDLSEELGRYDDALEYHAQLQKLDGSSTDSASTSTRLRLRKLLRDFSADKDSLLKELRTFTKKSPDDAASWEILGTFELETKNFDEAAQCFVRAAKLSQQLRLWQVASDLWIRNNEPTKALAAARAATKDAHGTARISAQLALVRTYLGLNMFDEAEVSLGEIPALAKAQSVSLDSGPMGPALLREISLLKSICYNSLGKYRESTDTLLALARAEDASALLASQGTLGSQVHQNGLLDATVGSSLALPAGKSSSTSESAPPPRLSTP